jgi:hypothetical protein
MTTGLTLGKFAPFHTGYQFVVGIGLYRVKVIRFISIQYKALHAMTVCGGPA